MDKTYSEKLKDPRWQKKRLEIMQRDNYACCDCRANGIELHVHHNHYSKDTEIWDYPDYNFVTLCKNCHDLRHGCLNMVRSFLSQCSSKQLSPILNIIQLLHDKKISDIMNIEFLINDFFGERRVNNFDDLDF